MIDVVSLKRLADDEILGGLDEPLHGGNPGKMHSPRSSMPFSRSLKGCILAFLQLAMTKDLCVPMLKRVDTDRQRAPYNAC